MRKGMFKCADCGKYYPEIEKHLHRGGVSKKLFKVCSKCEAERQKPI